MAALTIGSAVSAGEDVARAAVNGHEVALDRRALRRRRAALACAAVAFAAFLLVAAAPVPAMAWEFPSLPDVGGAVADAVGSAFGTLTKPAVAFFTYITLLIAQGVLQVASTVIFWGLHLFSTAGGAIGLNDFNSLMSSNGPSLVKDIAEGVCNNAVKPVCASILSLVMLSKLLKISQRVDGTQTMPALKEVIMLAVEVAFAIFLVDHAFPLCSDVFSIVNGFAASIQEQSGISWINFDIDMGSINGDGAPFTGIFLTILAGKMTFSILGLTIEAYKGFIARGLQIYLYAAFSPLMMTFFSLDETRQWAMGFIKGFIACALSGVVMYFAICVLPYALLGFCTGNAGIQLSGGGATINVTNSVSWVAFIGISAACEAIKALIANSGQYAREILGG